MDLASLQTLATVPNAAWNYVVAFLFLGGAAFFAFAFESPPVR